MRDILEPTRVVSDVEGERVFSCGVVRVEVDGDGEMAMGLVVVDGKLIRGVDRRCEVDRLTCVGRRGWRSVGDRLMTVRLQGMKEIQTWYTRVTYTLCAHPKYCRSRAI